MELAGEFIATSLLGPVDHGLLHVHGLTLHVYEPLAKAAVVELLEHVLK